MTGPTTLPHIDREPGETKPSTYAVASDFSEVIETDDGFGKFATRLEALEAQIGYLTAEREKIAEFMAAAKRLRRSELRRAQQVQP